MTHLFKFSLALLGFFSVCFSAQPEKWQGKIIGHGDFKYKVDIHWSKANPEKVPIKNCHEMVQSKDGRLFLLTDHRKNNIIIYNTEGEVLDTWTLNISGHGLTYDHTTEGDFLYLTGLGGEVIKTDLKGNVLLKLKPPHEFKAYSNNMKYTPTETAIAPNGDIYVADGYGSQFILHYDKNGNFIRKFGGKSTQPVNKGKFIQAHGIALDNRGEVPLLVCTARIRNEFHWYDLNGKFVKSVYLPGAYMSRPVIHNQELYSGICFGMFENDFRMWQDRGFVMIMDHQNKVVSNPGGTEPIYKDGKLKVMMQEQDLIKNAHDVCVDSEGNIYVCQWANKGTYPFKLTRIKTLAKN